MSERNDSIMAQAYAIYWMNVLNKDTQVQTSPKYQIISNTSTIIETPTY